MAPWDFPVKGHTMDMRLGILLLFVVLIIGAGLYWIFRPPKARPVASSRIIRNQPWDAHERNK